MPSFIEDGLTCDGHIRAYDGLHEGLTFQYRPMLDRAITRMSNVARDVATMTDSEVDQALSSPIADHLVTWDLKDSKGSAVPITAENVARLQPQLLLDLLAIVQGKQASDPMPKSKQNGELALHVQEDELKKK